MKAKEIISKMQYRRIYMKQENFLIKRLRRGIERVRLDESFDTGIVMIVMIKYDL